MSRFITNNQYGFKHGGTGTKLHNVWSGMKYRCLNSKNILYKYYGVRA